MLLLAQLSLIPAPDEQLNRTTKSMNALGEAPRLTSESRQIMTQFSIIAFDRVGLRFVIHRLMSAPPTQFFVSVEGIRKVARGMWRGVNHRLHQLRRALPTDRMRDDAARRPVYDSDDIGLRFFDWTKVNSSSISSVSGGDALALGAGKDACAALTQLTTDW